MPTLILLSGGHSSYVDESIEEIVERRSAAENGSIHVHTVSGRDLRLVEIANDHIVALIEQTPQN